MASRTKSPIYQLKITLKGIRPPIWRRVQVPGNIRLDALHDVVQIAMGWDDSHLHAFTVAGEAYYGDPSSLDELGGRPDWRTRLNQVAEREGTRLRYEYDFGDGWEHTILVEKILPPEPGQRYPRCVAGRRACPPEDVGGVWGYADFLEAIAEPGSADHDEVVEWVGDDFDPEAFDLEGTDAALRA